MWEARGDIDQRREKARTDHGGFEILVNLVSAFCHAQGRPKVNASPASHITLVAESWYCHARGESAPRSL